MKTNQGNKDMKFTSKLLVAAMVAMVGVVAVAQNRKYVRNIPMRNAPPSHKIDVEYQFTDSNGELGYRFISGMGKASACDEVYVKLVKSVESDTVLYTAVDLIRTCEPYRFVFPNGDLSSGYVQGQLPEGGFMPVHEKLAEWKSKGVNPSLTLKK